MKRLRGALAALLLKTLARVFGDALAVLLLLLTIALGVTFALLLDSVGPSERGRTVPISTVEALARAERIGAATLLDEDKQVVVRTTSGLDLTAAYPASDAETGGLLRRLRDGGARVAIDHQSGKSAKRIVVQFLMPVLLLVTLFAFFVRVGQDAGAAGFAAFSQFTGRSKRHAGTDGALTFADVAGAPEAVVELQEIRDYLRDPGLYARLGARPPKGVLLVGPPGTGKTLLARAVAGEAEAAFFSVSGAQFVELLVGVGAARIRDLFAKARRVAPAIIFIDELDAAGRRRGAGVGQGNDEREQTLNQLLVELDGFDPTAGLVVIAATNRPDILDPALLRPGRFDRQVTVDAPDVVGRLAILQLHARRSTLDPETDLAAIARQTPGFTGAELANVVNEAALLAVRDGVGVVEQPHLEEAVERVVAGPATRNRILTDDERWTVAIHEAAHAVAGRALGMAGAAHKLSILPRGRTLGTAAALLDERDMVVRSRSDLERRLMVVLAGAAAELLTFGETSSGVQADLQEAARVARVMVASYGMSPELGLFSVAEDTGDVFLGAQLQELATTSQATLELVDREARTLVEAAGAGARTLLEQRWPAVEAIAGALVAHETLSGEPLAALLADVAPALDADAA